VSSFDVRVVNGGLRSLFLVVIVVVVVVAAASSSRYKAASPVDKACSAVSTLLVRERHLL
jgi:hypothetical protein